jgi:pyridoxamine 5'-phosphate oxidase
MDNLLSYSLSENPFDTFECWYQEALKVEQNAPAMSVATYDYINKRPTSRFLLFKEIKNKKVIFYTNYSSPKSKDLDNNPEVALNFYWHHSQKQVRIQGTVQKMSFEDSKAYFHSRDRESQLASFISSQSAPIENKEELLEKLEQAKKEFADKEISMPTSWGGYFVDPYEFEFFLYGEYRLNDRFLYERDNGKWIISRLQP